MPDKPIAFAQNQREEVRDLGDIALCLNAEPGTHQQTFIAFTTEQTPKFSEDVAFTLTKGSPSGSGQIQSVMISPSEQTLFAHGDLCVWKEQDASNTLLANDANRNLVVETSPIVFPIDDGREIEKHQNGTGIGDAGAPSFTLDRAQHASVVIVSVDSEPQEG